MEISVIIPTYCPESYIWECLDSLVCQSFPVNQFEIIIVINGCCDPYKKNIEDYIACKMQNLNIVLIQTDTPGVSNARNIALNKAHGKYITFIDDDDLVSPFFLEELYSKVSPNIVSICYPYAFNDGEKNIQLPYILTDTYNYCITNKIATLYSRARKFFSGPWMKLIPSSFINQRRFDVRFKNGEDSIFMFLISDCIEKLAFTSTNAIYYRRFRNGSATKKNRSKREIMTNDMRCMKEYTKYYISGGYNTYFYLSRIAAGLIDITKTLLSK